MSSFALRPINADCDAEVALVAERMRLTLMEVVGGAEGQSMFSMDWLIDRVRWHLDASQCTGAVYVAERAEKAVGNATVGHAGSRIAGHAIVGHTIVRIDQDEDGRPMGLFSTTYVAKSARRLGIADALLAKGESWMRDQGLRFAATHTSETNTPLIRLYEKHQYEIVLRIAENKMIRLGKALL
jgi:GNAT superfamily N-acetyltransferase